MSRVHDIGGMEGFGQLETEQESLPFHADWEAQVYGLNVVLLRKQLYDLDHFRDAIERMDPQRYVAASYYERWLLAVGRLLEHCGILSKEDLQALGLVPGGGAVPGGGGAVPGGGDDTVNDHPDGELSRTSRTLTGLLEDRGVIALGEVDSALDHFLASASPLAGARVVARAWTDPAFAERLSVDANAAIAELGLSMGGGPKPQTLKVVANEVGLHNVVVCTLCSCYPLALLGPSPGWYKSLAYRAQVVRDPRAVLARFGLELPASTAVRVWDASAEVRYMVLPVQPPHSAGWTEERLVAVPTRQGMIGTAPW